MRQFDSIDDAWACVVSRHVRDPIGIHGPRHWAVVERNGLYLAEKTGVNAALVSLFALFHDSCRENDDHDPEHGPRAAEYARGLRDTLLALLAEEDFDKLLVACEGHTHVIHHADPAIAACWDADRLDLGRVGIEPNVKYLNTAPAKAIAKSRNYGQLHTRTPRKVEHYFT